MAGGQRRDLIIQTCRHRQQQIEKKLALVRLRLSSCSETEKARWLKVERELLVSYHQEDQRILRLQGQTELPPPSRPSPERESLQQQVQELQQGEAVARAEIQRLSQLVAQREGQITTLEKHLQDLEQALSEALSEGKNLAADLQRQLVQRDQEISELHQETEELLSETTQGHHRAHQDGLEIQKLKEQLRVEQQDHLAEVEQLLIRMRTLQSESVPGLPDLGDLPTADVEGSGDVDFSSIEVDNPPEWLLDPLDEGPVC
ncbi:hypothetical protein IV102_33170 [bacterium]|nr:hypothetical protein [bacterium]